MSKINPSDYANGRPRLTPEDLDGETAVLTIASVESITVGDDPKEQQEKLLLLFEEYEERPLWLNVTQIKTLIERLGDDGDDWIGQKAPVESHVAFYKGQEYPKVRVVPTDRWDAVLKPSSRRRAAQRKTSKKRRR